MTKEVQSGKMESCRSVKKLPKAPSPVMGKYKNYGRLGQSKLVTLATLSACLFLAPRKYSQQSYDASSRYPPKKQLSCSTNIKVFIENRDAGDTCLGTDTSSDHIADKLQPVLVLTTSLGRECCWHRESSICALVWTA